MFSSSRFEESYYDSQRDFITYTSILVIVFSLCYYGSVCIAELFAGSHFIIFFQRYVCCWFCPDNEYIRRKNMIKRKQRGSNLGNMEEEMEFGVVQMSGISANPMMMGSTAARKAA